MTRAAGAEGDVAEYVEDGELVRQIDQPIKHRLNLARTRLRAWLRAFVVASWCGYAALQRLDDGRHARAERAFDHDDVAGTDRGHHLRFERGGVLCIAAAAAGGKSLPQIAASAGRSRTPDRPRWRSTGLRPGRDASAGPFGPSSSMSPSTAMRRPRGPMRRLAEQGQRGVDRGRIGVIALVDEERRDRRADRFRSARRGRRPA